MKIVLNLRGKSDKDIVDFAYSVTQALTDNAADFTGISPTAADIQAAADDAQAKMTDQTNKQASAKTATQVKDDAITNVIGVLQKAANWTESNQPDPNKAGNVFPLKKAAASTTSIDQVSGLAVTFGDNPGELDGIWQPVDGAISYEVQVKPAGGAFATVKTLSKSKYTIPGLASGTTVQVRVRALGTKGMEGPWSDPYEHLVP